VVVIDDQVTLAELLGMAIDDQPDLTFLGYATSADAGVELVARTRPDVVVMDARLSGRDALTSTARTIAGSGVRVIILTAAADARIVHQAAAAGACAFLAKNGGLTQVFDTIRNARPGQMVVDTRLLVATSSSDSARSASSRVPRLTPREHAVLQHLALGLDATRIAKRLSISAHTCRGHIKSILAKLHCHTQVEALAVASRLGLVQIARTPVGVGVAQGRPTQVLQRR